jgi:transposase
MSNPIQLPADFKTYDFVAMSKKERNSRNKIRLIAMSHIQDGKTLKETGLALKVHWCTIQTWLRNFRNFGIEHLYVKATKTKPSKISKKMETWIVEFLTMLNNHDTGGHITGKQLQSIITKEFSIKCCLQTVYNTLHRLRFSWITSRSKHPKSDFEVQELYKKFSTATKKVTT